MPATIDRKLAQAQSPGLAFSTSLSVRSEVEEKIEDANDTRIICYENTVPKFVEAELVRIYGNFFSSLSHLKFRQNFEHTSTYVDRLEGRVISLFLFQREQSVVTVLNEVIAISNSAMERFSQFIFQRFHEVAVIKFRAIGTDADRLAFPFQRYNYLEDIVINLPQSTQEYFSILSKSSSRNLRRCQRKLQKEHPSFAFRIYADSAVRESDVREVIALNRARMIGKKKLPAIDEKMAERLVTQARENGLLCIASVDNKICAGALCVRTGTNYFMTLIAHDNAYDAYSLGKLCCTQMICECIGRGANEFHFLWGRYVYKFSLAGVQRDLYEVAIYRSKLDILLHLRLALAFWIHAKSRQAILSLQGIKRNHAGLVQLAMRFVYAIRRT